MDTNKYGVPLDILKTSNVLLARKRVDFLLIGRMGTGKTQCSVTGPKPVYYYGLDRAGSLGLVSKATEGWLVLDTRFEDDNPYAPRMYQEFLADIKAKAASKFFHQFGSLVIDGLTALDEIAMNKVLAERGRPAAVPVSGEKGRNMAENDYGQAMAYAKAPIQIALSQPCSVVLTAHIRKYQDRKTEEVSVDINTVGQHRILFPSWFSEVYNMHPIETQKGTLWQVATRGGGIYEARSSLAAGGRLLPVEPADLMAIIKKAGLQIPDVIPAGYYTEVPPELNTLRNEVQK